MRSLLLIIFQVSVAFARAVEPDLSLEDVRAEFQLKRVDLKREELQEPLAELTEQYHAALTKLERKAAQTGDLEYVLAIRDEMEALETGEPARSGDFAELERLRRVYRGKSDELHRKHAQLLIPLIESYRKELDKAVVTLTKAGKLDDAVAATEENEAMGALLTELKKNGSTTGSTERLLGKIYTFGYLMNSSRPLHLQWKPSGTFESIRPRASLGWVALRRDGRVFTDLSNDPLPFQSKIVTLGGGVHDTFVYGINSEGGIEFVSATDEALPADLEKNLEGVVDIRRGGDRYHHFLALKRDGTVVPWGVPYEKPGASPPPWEALTDARAIACAENAGYVVKNDGSVIGWVPGGDTLEVPAEITNIETVECGTLFAVALTSTGEVLAWGDPTHERCDVPDDLGTCVAVRAHGQIGAAQQENGNWVAWGAAAGGVVEKINSIGNAKDIAFYGSNFRPLSSYLVWIE